MLLFAYFKKTNVTFDIIRHYFLLDNLSSIF